MPLHLQLIMYSPIIGLAVAVYLYVRYRKTSSSGRPLPIFVYFPVVVIAGLIGFQAGKYAGIWVACTIPEEPGNLCGLTGYFLSGPLAATLAIVVTALVLRFRR